MSRAFGVAKTSEIMLYPASGSLPTRTATVRSGEGGSAPPLLAASPEHFIPPGVFGIWSLPDRSTPFKKDIEEGLDSVLIFIRNRSI